jgi:LmbE family N-acetylglucosaminyl deacetylase
MNTHPLRLMAVLAHPDDESLGVGGALAKYASEGIETFVVTATRGDRGRFFDGVDRPDNAEVGRVREGELGVREVVVLDYPDGDLDRAHPAEAIGHIVAQIRRVKPDVILTFDQYGAYGHPDHIAICHHTTAAIAVSGDASYATSPASAPHRVSKLYYMVHDEERWGAYQAAFKTLVSRVDGEEREATAWPRWAITTRIDARANWQTVWRAVQCHRTQNAIYGGLDNLTPEDHERLWGTQQYYRVFSLVNGGRASETDLFEGLR